MSIDSLGLHGSENDRFIAGICGGLAESWRVDANLIRLAWGLFTIPFAFWGIGAYVLAWFVLPVRPAASGETVQTAGNTARPDGRRLGLVAGWLLVAVGSFLLAERLTGGWLTSFLREFRRYLWPIILIGAGGALLIYRGPHRADRQEKDEG